jgi:hypothetical protein
MGSSLVSHSHAKANENELLTVVYCVFVAFWASAGRLFNETLPSIMVVAIS